MSEPPPTMQRVTQQATRPIMQRITRRVTRPASGPSDHERRLRSSAHLLEAVARGVRAGMSMSTALITAVDPVPSPGEQDTGHDLDPRLTDAVRRHRLGVPLVASLDAVRNDVMGRDEVPGRQPGRQSRRRSRPDDVLVFVSTVLMIAADHGGPSAEALDRAATTLRDQAALVADARTHAAPARLSATVLTVAPLGFSALAAGLDHDVRQVLVTTPVGWICAATGTALAIAGRRWMTRLVSQALIVP